MVQPGKSQGVGAKSNSLNCKHRTLRPHPNHDSTIGGRGSRLVANTVLRLFQGIFSSANINERFCIILLQGEKKVSCLKEGKIIQLAEKVAG